MLAREKLRQRIIGGALLKSVAQKVLVLRRKARGMGLQHTTCSVGVKVHAPMPYEICVKWVL